MNFLAKCIFDEVQITCDWNVWCSQVMHDMVESNSKLCVIDVFLGFTCKLFLFGNWRAYQNLLKIQAFSFVILLLSWRIVWKNFIDRLLWWKFPCLGWKALASFLNIMHHPNDALYHPWVTNLTIWIEYATFHFYEHIYMLHKRCIITNAFS